MKVKIFHTRVDSPDDLPELETKVNEWMDKREIISVHAYAHPGISVIVVTYQGE